VHGLVGTSFPAAPRRAPVDAHEVEEGDIEPAAEQGRAYIRDVAGYIATLFNQQQLVWGVDQVALFAVLMRMLSDTALKVAALPPKSRTIPTPTTASFGHRKRK